MSYHILVAHLQCPVEGGAITVKFYMNLWEHFYQRHTGEIILVLGEVSHPTYIYPTVIIFYLIQ